MDSIHLTHLRSKYAFLHACLELFEIELPDLPSVRDSGQLNGVTVGKWVRAMEAAILSQPHNRPEQLCPKQPISCWQMHREPL